MSYLTRRKFILGTALIVSSPSYAEQSDKTPQITAPEALKRAQKGDLILLDIRTREEWQDTGIANVAIPMSMHEPSFLQNFLDLKQENPGKEIALICATGGRTRYVQQELQKRGLGETIDVSEGMIGNGQDAGWINRGLPVKKFEE